MILTKELAMARANTALFNAGFNPLKHPGLAAHIAVFGLEAQAEALKCATRRGCYGIWVEAEFVDAAVARLRREAAELREG